MSKIIKKLFVTGLIFLTLAMVLALSNSEVIVYAANDLHEHDNPTSNSETNADFAEDRVLVVLSKQETMRFKNYTKDDFPEIGASSIDELTQSSSEVLERQINSLSIKNNEMEIDVDSYRTILSITLNQPGKENVLRAIDQLEKRSDVLVAEPDSVLHLESVNPNDLYYQNGLQWGLNGTNGINTPAAWGISFGVSTNVRVGIIDTGIDAGHPDLNVNINLSRDFSLPAPHVIATVNDSNGHGTHVAGIIGATGNNSIGITGIAQGIELVSLRIAPTNLGNSFASHLVSAINYATVANIPILSNSNGTDNFTGNANDRNVCATAIANYPGLFVTSAGNGNRNNNNNQNRFPSNVRLPNIISVGATSENGERASFSNWGSTTVDIFAPGTDILSTFPTDTGNFSTDHDYQIMSGTSMATPFVSGAAALLLSHDPSLSTEQIRNAILNNVTPVAALVGQCVTGGRLNTNAAIRSVGYETTNLSGDNIQINRPCTTVSGLLSIPSTLNDRTVTIIASSAFSNQTQLTQIVIPTSITTVAVILFQIQTKHLSIYPEKQMLLVHLMLIGIHRIIQST